MGEQLHGLGWQEVGSGGNKSDLIVHDFKLRQDAVAEMNAGVEYLCIF